jgi:predicted ATPase
MVRQEGGIVDRYMGNRLTAVFGLATTHRDDPLRAVRAALAMRSLYQSFLARLAELSQTLAVETPQFQLQIGLNTGPVRSKQLEGDGQTITGTTVDLAHRLAQEAKQSGIYLSQTTYNLVADRVQTSERAATQHPESGQNGPIYRVVGFSPRLFDLFGWSVAGIETPFLGRDGIMEQLRQLLAEREGGPGQLVTIIGQPGSGKSRLAFELGQWVRQQRPDILLLQAKVEQGIRPFPHALARNLLTTTLNIQDNEPVALVLEKLMAYLRYLQTGEPSELPQQANLLGQLLSLGIVADTPLVEQPDLQADDSQARYLREQAIAAWAAVVERTMKQWPATLIFLEDLHLADEESLHLMARVGQILAKAPVLLVCLARPTLYEQWPRWPHLDPLHTLPLPHIRFDLPPLADEASRQLVQHNLRHLADLPPKLVDLLVARAEGNPLFLEQLIKLLVDDGVIVAAGDSWYLREQSLANLRLPQTLTELWHIRVNHLSLLEQTLLQRASVMGRTFWETAVLSMSETPAATHTDQETDAALQVALRVLTKRGFIYQQASSTFAGTNAYLFKHNLLQQIAYERIPPRHRPLYHKQIADWLSTQSGERVPEHASQIAAHYELGGEAVPAARLYELAGHRAQKLSNLDAAVDNYCKTLSLLTGRPRHALWLLRLQEQLGPLLLRCLRLVEAAQVYLTLQYIANMDGELALQAQAWLGLAATQREQASYQAMQQSAQQGRQTARLVTAEVEEADALLLQSQAHVYKGDPALAQARAEEGLAICRSVSLLRQQALALGLLCQIHVSQSQKAAAQARRQELVQLAVTFQADRDAQRCLAFYYLVLAEVYQVENELALAHDALDTALFLCRKHKNLMALAQTQSALGRLALKRGVVDEAATYLRSAVALARSVGDEYGRIRYQLYLSSALLQLQQFAEAQNGLEWLLSRTGDPRLMAHWWGTMAAYDLLVQTHLACQRPALALATAQEAYTIAHRQTAEVQYNHSTQTRHKKPLR